MLQVINLLSILQPLDFTVAGWRKSAISDCLKHTSQPSPDTPQAVDSICSHDAEDAVIDGPLPGTKEEEVWREGWREGWQQGLEEGQAAGVENEELGGGTPAQAARSIAPTATP